MRLVAALVVLAGCGGSPKPAANAVAPITPPVAASEPAPPPPHDDPPPPEPETKATQVAVETPRKGGDPCEGGEATGMAAGEGGAGWKTLGTGNVSTIGHGSGTCCSDGLGSGVGRRAPSPEPTVTLGVPTVKGDLDSAIIRRYVKRNINKLKYCYEKTLLAKPDIHGKLVVKFTITDQGLTEDISTPTAFDADVGTCAQSVFKSIEFPKPKTATVSVSYPFTFALPKK